MWMNEDNKYTETAEYFWNPYLDMWCIIGTTYCSPDLEELTAMWETPELLVQVDMPNDIVDENSEW